MKNNPYTRLFAKIFSVTLGIGFVLLLLVSVCTFLGLFGSADDRWPLVVAKGKIDGGIYNHTGVEIKLTDVKVNGPIFGNVTFEGEEGVP